jgi:hypothetical protein
LQASHFSPQAELQHTRSAQKPDKHCVPDAQGDPLPSFGWQIPPAQYRPAIHVASEVHAEGQVAELPEQTSGEHEGLPATPAARLVQTPTEPGALQTSHWPLHEALQHTPSEQKPLWHCVGAVQDPPTPGLMTHFPPEQK